MVLLTIGKFKSPPLFLKKKEKETDPVGSFGRCEYMSLAIPHRG